MLYGYMRVSTGSQDTSLQRDALLRAGVGEADVFSDEGISGRKRERPGLNAALETLRSGDTLVCYSLSRLSRSVADLLDITKVIRERGAHFHSLTEHIDTSSAHGQFTFTVLSAIGQLEADLARERTLAGLAAARARGRIGGRPMVKGERVALLERLVDGGSTVSDAAAALGMGRAFAYRLLQQKRAGLR